MPPKSTPSTTRVYELLEPDEEIEERWIRRLTSNTLRVLDVFELRPIEGARNKWGDTPSDIVPVLEVLGRAARREFGNPVWYNLVQAGVVEALCKTVTGQLKILDHVTKLQEAQVASGKPRSEVRAEGYATYYGPLSILNVSFMSRHNKDPPAVNALFVTAMKTHWTAMINRVWDTNPNTDAAHSDAARDEWVLTFQPLLQSVPKYDPSALQVYHNHADRTVALAARYWQQACSFWELNTFGGVVEDAINAARLLPSSSLKMAHQGALFANILRGSNGSTKRFLAKFTESLSPDWPDDDEGRISNVPSFLSALLNDALDEGEIRFDVILGTARHDFIMTFIRATSLWKALFLLIWRPIKARTYDQGTAENVRDEIFSEVFELASRTLHALQEMRVEDVSVFIKTLVHAGLFDALDAALPRYATRQELMDNYRTSWFVSGVFTDLVEVSRRKPSLIPLIRAQLPRAASMRALLDAAYACPNRPSPPEFIDEHELNWKEDIHLQNLLQLNHLHRDCLMNRVCGRRGCKGRVTARCSACHRTEYCGPACQKRDWVEHRLVCGFALVPIYSSDDEDGVDDSDLVSELELPFRFRRKDEPTSTI